MDEFKITIQTESNGEFRIWGSHISKNEHVWGEWQIGIIDAFISFQKELKKHYASVKEREQ